jgi:hypothetical protein
MSQGVMNVKNITFGLIVVREATCWTAFTTCSLCMSQYDIASILKPKQAAIHYNAHRGQQLPNGIQQGKALSLPQSMVRLIGPKCE